VLAWLWRRLFGSQVAAAATPRRLVYVLPQGGLVEPVAIQAREWLTRLGLIDQVALHVVQGGSDSEGPRWRRDMHLPALVIGCADCLVSKALNHGYGIGLLSYPIDFALVTNGAQWVFDDVACCQRSADTVRQLASAAARLGTAEPFAVTCLPAAISPVRGLHAEPGDYQAMATAAAAMHKPGTRTLIVMNSVASATAVYSALADAAVPRVLIHSQFRGRERQALAEAVAGDPGDGGQIVVATRAARAGIDAACVVAEPAAAPAAAPAASAFTDEPSLPSMTDLFDAAVPVADFVDSADDLEAQLIWATWTSPAGGRPPEDARLPADEWRCRARLAEVDALAARTLVWRIDRAEGGWTALSRERPARPGEILLVAAADGGYDPALGFDPAIRLAVGDSPSVDPGPAWSDGGRWVSLRQHSEETRDQAVALLAAVGPELPEDALRAVECAAYLHDVGKAHPIWQDALCALAADDDRERIEAGRPWAKSGLEAPLVFAGDVRFRHELASLLLIDGPLLGLVDSTADRDLVRFLVLAHHGRLRLRVRDDESAESTVIHGLEQGATWPMPPMLGQAAVQLTVDLEQFGDQSNPRQAWTSPGWTNAVLSLLDRYGPFTLAYLETLVRVADWRSSGGEPLASKTLIPLEAAEKGSC
jgi:CRISPR-associated endonuclease Cas3-HD